MLVYGSHRLRVIEAIELVALDVFNARRRQITLGDVEHYLSQLLSHCVWSVPGGCDRAP